MTSPLPSDDEFVPPAISPSPPPRTIDVAGAAEAVEVSEMPQPRWWAGRIRRGVWGVLASTAVHVALLTALASLTVLLHQSSSNPPLVLSTVDDVSDKIEAFQAVVQPFLPQDVPTDLQTAPDATPLETFDVDSPTEQSGSPAERAANEAGSPWRIPKHWLQSVPQLAGGGVQGRTGPLRGRLLADGGGTAESEQAVALGLAWLAAHQRNDGSWRFDHRDGPCQGRCRHAGTAVTTTGATGMALLPFLGAGCVPGSGPYGETVERGLYYLTGQMRRSDNGGNLMEGTMYAQGLASIALCEACAMTDDSALRLDAQAAVDFICYAQNAGGGWRYQPKQPGDVTVTGWQMMALKSGQMGGLVVPSPTLMDAAAFLDGVQQDDGAFYGYLKPGKEPTPTAVGLLVRMYSGWSHDDARLRRGVEYLSRLGPSDDDVYFNYYATQVMHHYGGPHWERWNRQMREAVIAGQAQQGHERGSWYVDHEYGLAGGRLYTTAMCVMILEVYYRHMPLYRQQAIDTPF